MPSPRPFRLGGLTSDDLVDRWLVIEHEIVLNRPFYLAPPNHPDTDEAPSVYREYTHLSHEVFSELLRPKPWER